MARVFLGLIAIVSALSLPCFAYAADVRSFPEWSSDKVRSARPVASTTALVFDLLSTVQVEGQPAKFVQEKVTLAPSFVLVDKVGEETLDDGALCRTFIWSPGKPTFHNDSCYAVPAFRAFELLNRENLHRMMLAAKIKDSPLDGDPYWRESELGYQRTISDPLTKHQTGDDLEYKLGSETVVHVNGFAAEFQADESHRFVKFISLHTQLHPQVRRDLLLASSLPQKLEIVSQSAFKKRREILTISNAHRTSVDYPLPSGLSSDLQTRDPSGDSLRQKGIHEAVLAIEGRPSKSKSSLEDLESAAKHASEAGRPLDVLLLFLEVAQEYGPKLMTSEDGKKVIRDQLAPLLKKAMQDPETSHFMAASNLSGGGQFPSNDRQAAASFLAAEKIDDRPFGTFRYVTFANLVRGSGDVTKWDAAIFKSMPSPLADGYWVHIAAYPWSSLTYKDAGDAYLQAFDPADAWIAYDLGREVDKEWRSGTMKALSAFEDQLRATQPDLF